MAGGKEIYADFPIDKFKVLPARNEVLLNLFEPAVQEILAKQLGNFKYKGNNVVVGLVADIIYEQCSEAEQTSGEIEDRCLETARKAVIAMEAKAKELFPKKERTIL